MADAFGNRIGQDIHHVGVVAQTADQSVIAQTAVKDVVRSITGEGVGQGVAGEVVVDNVDERCIFEIAGQSIGAADRCNANPDKVRAFVG